MYLSDNMTYTARLCTLSYRWYMFIHQLWSVQHLSITRRMVLS